jgi:aryl-alcohol dehydrogenase-like predicted oxidoreductase
MSAVQSQVSCVTLPRSGLTVPRVGVGLAHVHLIPPPARAALIDTAIDLGMTHFDTSRFYSDGLSEQVLGSLLGKRRAQVTITTKFGLLPTPLIGHMGRMAPLGRKLRSVATRLKLTQYPKQRYTPDTLRRSLTASLKALRTDYVDVFAIHEPAGAASLTDELIDTLVAVRASGMARFIGVSGDTIDDVVERWGDVLDVVQTAEHGWNEGRFVPDFTYSLFSSGRARKAPPLSQKEIDARLTRALARRPNGAVIVQTRDSRRLAGYARLAA